MRNEKGAAGFRFFRAILLPVFKLYYRPNVIGKEKIPAEGPILIVGNHKHLYDQCLVIASTKRVVYYMAKKEYFDGKMAWFFRAVGCIPVDRGTKDEAAVSRAMEVLQNGDALGLFPEGTRNRTDKLLLPFKFGAVSMAKKTGATIVPFGIRGAYRFWKNHLTIEFGEPFQMGDMTLEEGNTHLEEQVRALITK